MNIAIKNFLKHLKKNLQKINTNPFFYFAFQYPVYNIPFRDNTITENLSETAKVQDLFLKAFSKNKIDLVSLYFDPSDFIYYL